MEPRQQSLESSPSNMVSDSHNVLSSSEQANIAREAYSSTHETVEINQAHKAESNIRSPVTLPPILPTPVADDTSTTPLQPVASSAGPLVAADDDLIEKEWVDKAKHIVENTRDDPYRREQDIKSLQIDYIRKRYGREIGDNSD